MDANAVAGEAPIADMAIDGKPVCGGDKQVGEYDVGIHVLGLCELVETTRPSLAWH
jgi:zinc transporter 1/2/3